MLQNYRLQEPEISHVGCADVYCMSEEGGWGARRYETIKMSMGRQLERFKCNVLT